MEGEPNLGTDSDTENNNDNSNSPRRGTNRDGIAHVKEIEKVMEEV